MEAVNSIIIQKDGYKTQLYHFACEGTPKACILILHGMAEHLERYYHFIQFLNSNGLDAYIYNHRGHGTDKAKEDLGFFASSKGYVKVIDDALNVITFIENNKRCDKFILMGHSMGSLIARNVVQQYDQMDGLILSGTTFPSTIKVIPGLILASVINLTYGAKHRSPLINTLIFGGKSYTNPLTASPEGSTKRAQSQTPFDWLTRNKSVVKNYINDPYCGFICTISFYKDLLNLTLHASNESLMANTRKELPIFIISGQQDPVGGCGKEILHLCQVYSKMGFPNITSKLYPECRHELLHELIEGEIMKDILDWVNK